MSKSILVIDTPKCCGECPMSGTDVCRKWNRKDLRGFPKDCPLKEIPQKYPAGMNFERGWIVEQLEIQIKKREEQLRICCDKEVEDYLRCKMSGIAEAIEIVKAGVENGN